MMDVLVRETHQQIVAAIEVQHIMKEIVVFARSVSQECEQRVVEELVDVLVEVFKTNRVADVGSPAPQITKEPLNL